LRAFMVISFSFLSLSASCPMQVAFLGDVL